jgi:hypothetical protein
VLNQLRAAGAADQVAIVLVRDPAASASLDSPHAVAALLDELRQVEATDQVATLATRAVAQADLDDRHGVIRLLDALRKVGDQAQVAELIERLPAVGLFELFLKEEGRGEKFRFGRRADGRPAERWAWTDLD